MVTEQQLQPKQQAAGASAGPVRVTQADALQFAAQATTTLRQTGKLKPTEKVRLPRKSEAKNPAIWHEDDVPSTEAEEKPFGLVITRETEDRSPEGIPLRTDIPEGRSPLEKTGPDKPLWKRPE